MCRFGGGLRAWTRTSLLGLVGRLRAGGVCAPPAARVRWWLDCVLRAACCMLRAMKRFNLNQLVSTH